MIPVYYRKEQIANAQSLSKSPLKPELVVNAWLSQFKEQLEIREFEPITREHLYQIHHIGHVDGVLDCILKNGFGNKLPEVANSLLYTSGSMLRASIDALQSMIAVSPTSGFHHASFHYGEGFCTFNGLMLSAVELLKIEQVKKVGILDLDMHYGNGTEDIIIQLNLKDKIHHFTGGREYLAPSDTARFFNELPIILHGFKDCNIMLYQAGADSHIKDPFGGWLTTEQMYNRDLEIFKFCKSHNIPCVFNLAGGYQEPIEDVISLHVNTMKACVEVYG